MLAPTIFMFGLSPPCSANLTQLPGFTTDEYLTFILPVGFLQGAGFTGAATGVNLARDIELGWFDRLLARPPRAVCCWRHGAVREPARADADHAADDRRRWRWAWTCPGSTAW